MAEAGLTQKYSVHETGPRIEEFLRRIIDAASFSLTFKLEPGDNSNPEFETRICSSNSTVADVDLLLSNRAELLLALELVTQEMLRMHFRRSFARLLRR